jgi:hypothetical protein
MSDVDLIDLAAAMRKLQTVPAADEFGSLRQADELLDQKDRESITYLPPSPELALIFHGIASPANDDLRDVVPRKEHLQSPVNPEIP